MITARRGPSNNSMQRTALRAAADAERSTMENKSLLIAYLAVWIPYVTAIHGYTRWRQLSHSVVVLSHAVPSLVAMTMAYIFLLCHGQTVRQFVANSDRGMDLWSLWVDVWPMLLQATFAAGVAQLVWMMVVSVRRSWRPWVPVALTGTAMCAFAFLTVICNFPDA